MFVPNTKGGLLAGGYGMNPLMALGSGLLSQGGYTTMPVSTGQGLAAGFENMQRQGLLSAQMQRQEQEDAYRQQILDMKRAEAERQAAAQRTQGEGMAGLLAQVPPEHRATVAAIAAVDPKRGAEVAQGLLMPEPEKLPTSVQEALWLESAPPDQRAAYMAMKQAGASRTNVNVNTGSQGGLSWRPLTEEERVRLGYSPEEASNIGVDDKGVPRELPRSPEGDIRAKTIEFRRSASTALDAYETAVSAYRSNPTLNNKIAADTAQAQLAIAVAQARNPQGEPSDTLVNEVRKSLPSHFGIEQGVGSLLGADPWAARMNQLRIEMQGQQPSNAPQAQTLSTDLRNMSTTELLQMVR